MSQQDNAGSLGDMSDHSETDSNGSPMEDDNDSSWETTDDSEDEESPHSHLGSPMVMTTITITIEQRPDPHAHGNDQDSSPGFIEEHGTNESSEHGPHDSEHDESNAADSNDVDSNHENVPPENSIQEAHPFSNGAGNAESTDRHLYYCHVCARGIDSNGTLEECPLCSNGFIEEIERAPSSLSGGSSNGVGQSDTSLPMNESILPDGPPGWRNLLDGLLNEVMSPAMTDLLHRQAVLDPAFQRGHAMASEMSSGTLQTVGVPFSFTQEISGPGMLPQVRPQVLSRQGTQETTNSPRPRRRRQRGPLTQRDLILQQIVSSLLGNGTLSMLGNTETARGGNSVLDDLVTQLLESQERPARPVPPDVIERLARVKFQADGAKEMQCGVCLEAFEEDNEMIRLPCEHFYHPDCILPWFTSANTCPTCRQVIE